ncbi:Uncharacterized conserved protein YndB, AHSA1/START domain [Pleomorphomonas diazotrophica]|nr:SRPBCC domain-containing protein [Pleomorphomonas diazotrophica]SFM95406.1 Uncharacterized conserved protein YndB, AHSA1/START domain [Pleomorphomonas diazotrophica]
MKKAAEVEKLIEAPRAAVWKAMVAPDTALFPQSKVETDWQVGHPIQFSGNWKGRPYQDRGEIVAVEPEARLEFTHWSELSGTEDRPENYHTVRYELTGDDRRTTVRLTQFNHGNQDIDDKTRAEFAANWDMMLNHLKQTVEKA